MLDAEGKIRLNPKPKQLWIILLIVVAILCALVVTNPEVTISLINAFSGSTS